MSKEIVFVDGFFFNERKENQPAFVIGRVSFAKEKFLGWLERQEENERGYVAVQILRSKGGSIYATLDAWKPESKPAPAFDPGDVPF